MAKAKRGGPEPERSDEEGAHEHEHGAPEAPGEITSYSYRGRRISLSSRPEGARLEVDGREIHLEQDEAGVIAHHEMPFVRFGSPEELAEELIRQQGTAEIEWTPPKGGHGPH